MKKKKKYAGIINTPQPIEYGACIAKKSTNFTPTGAVFATINNVLNSYNIEKAWNPTNIGTEIIEVNPDDVQVFYSFGRVWSLKLKVDL